MAKSDPNEFSTTTKDILGKKAGQVCSKCKRHTSGGNTNPKKATIIGEAAHIEGAKPSDRRYNLEMTPEERSDIKNGIWLCGNCHKEVDDDPSKFIVSLLHKMKKDHEESILNVIPQNFSLQVNPKKLNFNSIGWEQKLSFYIINNFQIPLFEIYLLINISNAHATDFKIKPINIDKQFNEKFGDAEMNCQFVLICGVYSTGKEYILLKIFQINPNSTQTFSIRTNTTSVVNLHLLEYSKEQQKILKKDNEIAIQFKIPANLDLFG